MNLRTKYLGLDLKNPVIVSSSKLTGELRTIKHCAEAGAGAVVLKSLFEEQLRIKTEANLNSGRASEMYFWFPEAREKILQQGIKANMEIYLNFVKNVKSEIDIPVIASINCQSAEDWPFFASSIQEAGADALELNIGIFPFDKNISSKEIEDTYTEILSQVKKFVTIPVSVKLGHYFTNVYAMVNRLCDAGVDGLVLFNRYFRPDIDIDSLKVIEDNYFSSPEEIYEPMRWIALFKQNNLKCDIAASTGIHTYVGVVKQLLAGADVTQICSTLFLNGIDYIKEILNGLEGWMKKHNFDSIDEFRGKSLGTQTLNASFERLQYINRNME